MVNKEGFPTKKGVEDALKVMKGKFLTRERMLTEEGTIDPDPFFNMRLDNVKRLAPSRYWTRDEFKSSTEGTLGCYSKIALMYPTFCWKAKLIDSSGIANFTMWMGVERGAGVYGGMASFLVDEPNELYAVVGGQGGGTPED